MPVVPCGARGKTVGATRSVVGRRLPTVRLSVQRRSFALLGTADHVHGDAVTATASAPRSEKLAGLAATVRVTGGATSTRPELTSMVSRNAEPARWEGATGSGEPGGAGSDSRGDRSEQADARTVARTAAMGKTRRDMQTSRWGGRWGNGRWASRGAVER